MTTLSFLANTTLQQEATALYNLAYSLVQIVADVKPLRTHPAIIAFFHPFGDNAKGQVSGDQLERFRRFVLDDLVHITGPYMRGGITHPDKMTIPPHMEQHVADVLGLCLCVQERVSHGNVYTNPTRRAFFNANKDRNPELATAKQWVDHFNREVAKATVFGRRFGITPTITPPVSERMR